MTHHQVCKGQAFGAKVHNVAVSLGALSGAAARHKEGCQEQPDKLLVLQHFTIVPLKLHETVLVVSQS